MYPSNRLAVWNTIPVIVLRMREIFLAIDHPDKHAISPLHLLASALSDVEFSEIEEKPAGDDD